MSQPLGLLDVLQEDDSLRCALLRTPASDHVQLRQTCSRIREIIDSPIFAQERSEHGFAEVSVSIVSSSEDVDLLGDDFDSEQYNDLGYIGEYGETSSEATIFVDGNKAGTISMKLLPLYSQDNFHEVGDSISAELQEITTLFFTPRGKPTRVRSIKQAYQEFLAQEETHRNNSFLYITTFELKAPYRTACSNIGALALRYLLKTVLNRRWTLAMYIPYGRTQMTKKEIDLKYGKGREPHQSPTEEYMNIFRAKTIQDMRQFLRAGFAQVKETVLNTDCDHVFCVPSFLEEELLSHDQALAIPIKTRPKPPPKLSENAQALLSFLISSCSSRRWKLETIMSWRVPALEHPLMRSQALSLTASLELLQETREELESVIAILPSVIATQSVMREKLDSAAAKIEEFHQTLEQHFQNMARGQIEEVEQKLEELDTNVRSKVTQRVEECGYGIILQSNSIHACASNLEASYIEMLMGFLPSDQKTQAINGFDENGVTPLMLTAAKIVDTRDKQLQTCRLLLNLDANNDIVDANGMTALGRFRDSQRANNDFIRTMTPSLAGREHDANEQHKQQMEALLMPSSGPTEADDAILEDDPPDSEDDGVWDDFDDDDDDDADY